MDHRVAQVTQTLSATLGLDGERMSKVDTAWLRMDSPSNLMMIVGVWVLKPALARADLIERVRDRLLPYRCTGCARAAARPPSRRCRRGWATWPCSRSNAATRCGSSS